MEDRFQLHGLGWGLLGGVHGQKADSEVGEFKSLVKKVPIQLSEDAARLVSSPDLPIKMTDEKFYQDAAELIRGRYEARKAAKRGK